METWKDVRGYEGLYQVSDLGRIRSCGRVCNSKNNSHQCKRPRILTQEINMSGYCRVRLFNAVGDARHYQVHRLVYEAFVGDCVGFEINHINEIKTDNRLCNLEKMTAKDNCNYGTRNERISRANKNQSEIWSRPVKQYDKNGTFIKEYSSRLEAEKETGIDNGHISKCCKGERQTAGGYKWSNSS